MMLPAPPGTGIIAGNAVRAIMEAAGIHNVVCKSVGTRNPHNVIRATFEGLSKLETKEHVEAKRGKALEHLHA